MRDPTALPFPALVGLDAAQRALLLLAVDPALGGVVLAAGAGTGKSSLMRSYAALLAEVSPDTPPPFVELPVGITEDRLLGGLDLERTIQTGTRTHRSGILAAAHGGLLYADGINLLDDTIINHVLAALDVGAVHIEREGLSLHEPARFALLATYDPAEGTPRQHLLDRVGLIVAPLTHATHAQRMAVIRRNMPAHTAVEDRFLTWEEETATLQAIVAAARELLPEVQCSDTQLEQLTLTALAFGVVGHRADLFAVRCATAAAALAGRTAVNDDDLQLAVQYVLLPRATRLPQPAAPDEPAPPPDEPAPSSDEPAPPPDEPAPPPDEPASEDEDDAATEPDESAATLPPIEDLILDAVESDLGDDVLALPFMAQRRGRSGSRGSTSGQRGRHVRSVPGEPGQGRIDIVATLRAAAPWQQHRRAAAPDTGTRPLLRRDDVHIKQYRSKAGTLFCFLVDASGSMAIHRMRQAKGAVNVLLQQAYVHRDQVALLAFRGEHADLLLPPSQSVELARRALDVLPTGGGTPLAAALLAAYQLAAQARSRGILQTTFVLITDGKPNVPLHFDPAMPRAERLAAARDEVQHIAARVRVAGIGAVVIDTQRQFLSRGEAEQLAGWLGGRYVYLPQGRGEQIAQAVLQDD